MRFRRPRPTGLPISRFLDLPESPISDRLRAGVAAIEAVHGVDELPSVPVRIIQTHEYPEWQAPGTYLHRRDGTPEAILVRAYAQHPALTLVHEVGHLLDHQWIGNRGIFASEQDEGPPGWLEAVAQTATIQRLTLEYARLQQSFPPPLAEEAAPAVAHVRKLLREKELWARTYAQFVTVRSRNRWLRTELESVRSQTMLHFPQQWPENEFNVVAQVLDAWLRSRGAVN
jgi:hypothetical protein